MGGTSLPLRAIGGGVVLADRALVAAIEEHSDETQLELAEGADAQVLLRKLIESGAVISKFESVEPSLNDIFLDQVRGSEGGHSCPPVRS